MKIAIVLASIFVSAGIAAGGYFISNVMYKSHTAVNTAQVKGLAERRVSANVGDVRIDFVVHQMPGDTVPAMYRKAQDQQNTIIETIKNAGFTSESIDIGAPQYDKRAFRNNAGQVTAVEESIRGTVFMETANVSELQALKGKVSELLIQGIQIEHIDTNLRFTDLNTIKPDMLKEATQNARIAAEEFANHAGVEVGAIRSAFQGGFSITDVGSDYGDTEKMNKDVRVVTTIDFYLED